MRFIIVSGTVLLLHLFSSCSNQSGEMADASFANLIPKPVKAERGKGYFQVPVNLNIYVSAADSSAAVRLAPLANPASSSTSRLRPIMTSVSFPIPCSCLPSRIPHLPLSSNSRNLLERIARCGRSYTCLLDTLLKFKTYRDYDLAYTLQAAGLRLDCKDDNLAIIRSQEQIRLNAQKPT